jgi:hypothetical protein
MSTFYNLHFANYNLNKKQVIQFIPIVVWKQIYTNYQVTYLDSYLAEGTFKDQWCDTLKELKTRISIEMGLGKTTLQCDQMLEHLKAANGHATRSILKRHQHLIDGAPL